MEFLVPILVLVGLGFAGWKIQEAARRTDPNIICPNGNCGFTGAPLKESRGSVVTGLVLCCFFLLPGVVYFIVKGGYRYLCPKCGLQIRSDN